MQQIVYDIIDNCFRNDKKNINGNNSSNINISITKPPISFAYTNNVDNNIPIATIDTKNENKKIIFSIQNKERLSIINNYNNKNILLEKKRKRIFSIQKIKKDQKEPIKKIKKKIFSYKKFYSSPSRKINNKNNNNIIDIVIDKNNNNKNNNSNNNNNNVTNSIDLTNNNVNNRKRKKKSSYANEKILQLMKEKKMLEKINKEYSDKDYEKDMVECLKNKQMKFMYDNFPAMFEKNNYYLYTILPKKKLFSRKCYIEPGYFRSNNNGNIYNYYDTLYTNYDLYYNQSENIKDVINIDNNSNKNIINQNNINYFNIEKNNKLYNNFLIDDYININNENISNNNSKLNNIYKVPKAIEINEDNINNNKHNINDKDNNFINNNNKNLKTKKKIKNNKNKVKNKTNIISDNSTVNGHCNIHIKEKLSLIPKKIWSLNNNKINIDNFFEDCIQIWPFDECCFVKEIALEFLMKNNYSIEICLDKINEFVFFMKKRAKELDFPIINGNITTLKRYSFRKTNFN